MAQTHVVTITVTVDSRDSVAHLIGKVETT